MTYRNYRSTLKKQISLYVAVVGDSKGEDTNNLLDEIQRLRHIIARIDRMTDSQKLQPIRFITFERESIINNTNFKP